MDSTQWLLLAAVVVNGLLAGCSLDQSIKQLPARHRIGNVAFSEYSKAGDLGNGLPLYVALGVGCFLLTIVAGIVGLGELDGTEQDVPLWLMIGLTIVWGLATSRAAPTNFSQRKHSGDEAALRDVFDRFTRWQTIRVTTQVLALLTVVWAFAVTIDHA